MLQTRFIKGSFTDGTFTDQNHLSTKLMTRPEILDSMIYAFGSRHGVMEGYNVLHYLTQGRGANAVAGKSYRHLGNDQVQWSLMGNLMEAQVIAGTVTPTTNVGINFSEFVVPFSKKYFGKNWVCRFEDETLALITKEPEKIGDKWCYTFQIVNSNPQAFVQPFALESGREVTWSHTAYSENSEGGNSVEAFPMWFTNQLTTMRMSYGMTGSAKNDVVVFEIMKNGKSGRVWMWEKQFQYLKQWATIQESLMWSGRYNRLDDGTIPHFDQLTGYPIKMGSGIEEQISGVNTMQTSMLTTDMLEFMLSDINTNTGKSYSKRVLITGNGGMLEFHNAIRRSALQYQIVDTHFISNNGVELTFGAFFTTYKTHWGEFTVVNHQMFNDPNIFPGRVGPRGYTRQSYKMFFLNFEDGDSGSNIELITRGVNGESRQLVQWYTAGAVTPDFQTISGKEPGVASVMRSHGKDSFQVYTLSETGVIIKNPLSCGLIQINPEPTA